MLYKDTNQIKRNYYLNLFSTNAEIKKSPYSILSASGGNQNQNQNGGGGNGNQNQNQNGGTGNNWIYEWNIRDLQLSKYAEIALVQIANNKADYTEERQYPPKAFNSAFGEETATTELQNILPTTFKKQTITLNTSGITYGSGYYIIYSSTTYGSIFKNLLFDFNLNNIEGSGFQQTQYSAPQGLYLGNNYIVSGYTGDWIIIKFPVSIILTQYSFQERSTLTSRAPAEWKVYGSNDGVNFTEISQASQMTRLTASNYSGGKYTKSFNNSISYLYIGFTFNKNVGGANSDMINFNEIQLFGREEIKTLTEERQYPSKAFNSVSTETTTTFLGKSVFTQTITLNATDITYGSGNYILYSSSQWTSGTQTPSLTKSLLFDYTDFGFEAHWQQANYTPDGVYNKSNFIIPNYLGDWIIVKLPTPIILTKYYFKDRDGQINRAPAEWKVYGSNDGINFIEITQASQMTRLISTDYVNRLYTKTFNNSISYLYIGFTFNKVVGTTTGDLLNFGEIRLFGSEEFPNKYIIRSLNTYNDGYDSQNTTNAILYMNNELVSPKNPTYHKLNTNHLNRITLQVNDDIEEKTNNGWKPEIQFGAVFHIKNYKDT